MTLELDPQIKAAIVPLMARLGSATRPPAGDWEARREMSVRTFAVLAEILPDSPGVSRTPLSVTASDGTRLSAVWYATETAQPGSAALFIHGGGMITGSVDGYDRLIARYVASSGVPLLAIDYRLAPEFPHPFPVEDCHAAFLWLVDHAPELGVDPNRIGVLGESSGGGIAAGLTLLVHDRGGPPIARQILVYPMLDDRTTTVDPHIAPFAMWSYDDNATGWSALLGDSAGSELVSEYAAPSRRKDLSGLPPTYIDVGGLDIFRDEDARYALKLAQDGVAVEFHMYPGVPHSFMAVAPDSDVAVRALAARTRALQAL